MSALTVISKTPVETVVDRSRSNDSSEKINVQSSVRQSNKADVTADTQTNHDCYGSFIKSSDSINKNIKQIDTGNDVNNDVKCSSRISRQTNGPPPNNKRQPDKIDDVKVPADEGPKEKSSVIRKSSTTTLSKFKEKRPEPLKLNPNLNQDIPLDLSVKSAGNAPAGTLSNIFNLAPIGQMPTLETPRIQWQDNDALLTAEKARSFSSSTNASQRARISSLMGESPPTTPNSPLMEMMLSSSRANLKTVKQPHSASLILESSPLIESTFESRKSQILDRWAHSTKPLIGQSRTVMKGRPRRSCSSDDLNLNACDDPQHTQVDKFIRLNVKQDEIFHKTIGYNSKKNSISPLAIKSFSHAHANSSSPTKFLYSSQQIETNLNDTQQSPTIDDTNNRKSLTPTSLANATANLLNIHLNSPTGNSRSPVTSVSDVSNVNQQNQISHYKSTNFASYDHEPSPLDPLISAAFCQQQQRGNPRSASVNISSPSLTSDHNNNYHHNMIQHHAISSISSSNTLNTPTLISPSQLRAGHLCFQPSPTLSPISSVFDLPSPFLMFPSSSQNQTLLNGGGSQQTSPRNIANMADANIQANTSKSANRPESYHLDSHQAMIADTNNSNAAIETTIRNYDTSRANSDDLLNKTSKDRAKKSSYPSNNVLSANNLSHLITSATRKILQSPKNQAQGENADEDVDMDIDCESAGIEPMYEDCSQKLELRDMSARPMTVIPQIRISDHKLSLRNDTSLSNSRLLSKRVESQSLLDKRGYDLDMNENPDQRSQRNSSNKRSLSPESFRVQVSNYRSDRFESSSAPPDVNQSQVRAKMKTVDKDSCSGIDDKNNQSGYELENACLEPYSQNQASKTNFSTSRSQPNINQRNQKPSKFHPKIHERSPSSTQNSDQVFLNSRTTTVENRSISAEPVINSNVVSGEVNQCMSATSNSENTFSNCCQFDVQTFQENNLTHSAQQLHYASQSEALMLQDANGAYQPVIAKQDRQNSSTFEPNQQLPSHHHSSKYNYYQQQHSISTGELHKVTNELLDRHPNMVTDNAGHHPFQDNNQYQRQQPPAQHLFRPCQQFNQQTISSSLNRVDCLSNSYQQIQTDQKNQQIAGMVLSDPSSMMRQTSNQISVMNILCNNGSRHINTQQKNVPIHLRYPIESSTNAKLSISLHSSYQIDLETRSDSSCSLDFTNPFLGGSSRPNSAASSNMASKKYHCDRCPKSFARSDMLTRHRRLHSGDRPFLCTECKQEFSRSDHLSTHLRTHTGDKPYKCKMCSYSACRKDMITRHLKVHSRGPHSADCL